MLRRSFVLCLLVLLVLGCQPATLGSRTYFGFAVDISNAPPPPRIRFIEAPRVEPVPGSSVYVVEGTDYDMFRFGAYWYITTDGYWYRAASYGGPYAVVEVRHVPRAVLNCPPEHWKHPPRGRGWSRGRGPGA